DLAKQTISIQISSRLEASTLPSGFFYALTPHEIHPHGLVFMPRINGWGIFSHELAQIFTN
ncbi:MAG: hypothetical protein SPF81_03060, partial [Sodaliphilus sp.]|nr:hypothetical protein [Sodaliphilus sp.]